MGILKWTQSHRWVRAQDFCVWLNLVQARAVDVFPPRPWPPRSTPPRPSRHSPSPPTRSVVLSGDRHRLSPCHRDDGDSIRRRVPTTRRCIAEMPVVGGAPPGWDAAQHANDNRGPAVLGAHWGLTAFGTVLLALRIYCKKFHPKSKRGLWWDDYILIGGWVGPPLMSTRDSCRELTTHIGT